MLLGHVHDINFKMMADLKREMRREGEKNLSFLLSLTLIMEPRNPNSLSTRSTFRQPYTTFRPWNLQRLNQGMSTCVYTMK